MPAVAVVGAVAAISTAVTTGTTLAIIAAVGATISAVGAITGVKELQYAGMALGAVGAIGGLASSAGLFSSAAETGSSLGAVATDAGSWAGEGASAATVAGDAAAGGYTAGMAGIGEGGITTTTLPPVGEAATVAPTTDIVDMVTSGNPNFQNLPITEGIEVPTTTVPDVLPETAVDPIEALPDFVPENPNNFNMVEAPQGLIESQSTFDQFGQPIAQGDMTPAAGGELGPGVRNPAAVGDIDPTAKPGLMNEPTAVTATEQPTVTGAPAGAPVKVTGTAPGVGSPWDAGVPGSFDAARSAVAKVGPASMEGPSAWTKIMDFLEKRPTLLLGGLQAAGSFLSGAMSPLTPAQVAALEAQAASNQAAANLARSQDELLQRRLNNMSQPLPVATRTPRMPVGLVNTPGPAVTGRPA